jgi:hypothetical protein
MWPHRSRDSLLLCRGFCHFVRLISAEQSREITSSGLGKLERNKKKKTTPVRWLHLGAASRIKFCLVCCPLTVFTWAWPLPSAVLNRVGVAAQPLQSSADRAHHCWALAAATRLWPLSLQITTCDLRPLPPFCGCLWPSPSVPGRCAVSSVSGRCRCASSSSPLLFTMDPHSHLRSLRQVRQPAQLSDGEPPTPKLRRSSPKQVLDSSRPWQSYWSCWSSRLWHSYRSQLRKYLEIGWRLISQTKLLWNYFFGLKKK